MKIHLRADKATGTHTFFTVFVGGANTGQICMREEEAVEFYRVVQEGCARQECEFRGSGEWTKVEGAEVHANAEGGDEHAAGYALGRPVPRLRLPVERMPVRRRRMG